MRKPSQSMYQQQVGKGNASQRFGNTLDGLALSGSALHQTTRKVEGFDQSKGVRPSFEQTIGNLKSKPTQKVLEDEYIRGLQEEIKYLEYELKLLKDKEILEREGVNQLDNFLKDEIPINENILAMKNKYNATKAKLQQQFKLFETKNAQADDVLKTQRNEIDRLHLIIDAHRKQKNDRRNEFKEKVSQLVSEATLTSEEYISTQEDSRRLLDEIKKMNQEISIIQRQQEKQRVMQVRLLEEKGKANEKFEEKVRTTKEDLVEYQQKIEQLEQLDGKNPLLDPLEEQNSNLRKKIMLNEKQKSTAENTIAQIQLYLREQARQREIQRQQKQKYLVAAEECRAEILNLERYMDTLVKDQTLRTKKLMIKEMTCEFQEKEDVCDLLADRLRGLEQECSNLIQEKKELQDSLAEATLYEKELNQQTTIIQGSIVTCKSKADSQKRVTQEIIEETLPIQAELQQCKGTIPMVQKDIEKKTVSIHHLNKQIDLLKELKSLDLQQLQMISQGGAQMQNALHSFIRNWEKIKSL